MAHMRWRHLAIAMVPATAAIVAVTVSLVGRGPGQTAFQAQSRQMLPTINAYLQTPGNSDAGNLLARSYPKLEPKWFCDARIIEIRRDDTRWRVGMDVQCGEFARRGSTLVEGTGGDQGDEIMTLSYRHGRYRVLAATPYPSIGPDPGWVDRNFSPRIAAEINRDGGPMAPDPVRQASQAFGFPPGTHAVEVG